MFDELLLRPQLVAALHSNHFLVADWPESQELRL